MAKRQEDDTQRASALGKRLLILTILTILLIIAAVWMSIYLFDSSVGLGFDDLGIFTKEFNMVDTLLPRIL